MDEKKLLLIFAAGALYGAFVIGTEQAMNYLIMTLVGGGFWLFTTYKKKNKFKKYSHLSGHYKFEMTCLKELGKVYADINYNGSGDGNLILNKLYVEGTQNDIRHDINDSDWNAVQEELKIHLRNLRK